MNLLMAIKIGAIESIGSTNNLERIPDDRQTLVKTVTNNGTPSVTVEDYGVVANGEIISCNAVFSASDYTTLLGYWSNRTQVRVELDDGTVIANARVVIRRSSYYDNLLNAYKTVQLEIWRV